MFPTVIKADLLTNQNIQSGASYMFSTKDNNLAKNFTGGDISIILPNTVLKTALNQLPSGK